jgi:putative ABC transport system ATP-binding protein
MTAPTAPAPPAVAARAVGASKIYGKGDTEVRALDGVTVDFPAHVFTAIMGPSGSGKSTLMQCVAGLDTLTSGQVFVAGAELSSLSEKQLTLLRRDKIGFVFQAFNLVPTLDVRGNILLPFELDGRRPTREQNEWIDHLVDTLGLGDRLTHRPHELSGGQQQRAAIVRALATRPDLVFADEPTGNLDSRTGREVLGVLQEAARTFGQSIAMVTHDPVAASYADHIVFLADGRVAAERPQSSAEEISSFMLGMEARA